jgi:hypothetical protein
MAPKALEQGNRRLLKLAAFLRRLPRKRFDFGEWVGFDWKGSQNLSCGTTACALGWAATMPNFRRLGMYLAQPGVVRLKGKTGISSIEVAQIIFGLDHIDAISLFAPSQGLGSNATPKQVARRIEQFVAARREP